MESDYTDLRFNNDQLLKLVASAEVLFRHLYDLVSPDDKAFIDQWLCFKEEYNDACSSNSQLDVNENVPECSMLPRIDEVSEKLTSSISSEGSLSDSSFPALNSDSNKNYLSCDEKTKGTLENFESQAQSETNAHLSQIDSDLLDYMTDFKLFNDSFVTDWFKTFSFSVAEIREYLTWLENKDYKRVWTDLLNNAKKKSGANVVGMEQENLLNNINNLRDDFTSIDASRISKNLVPNNKMQYVPFCQQCSNDNRFETIDRQIRHLQEVRHVLLRTRETINCKIKKDEANSSSEFKRSLKVDVAFEVIDASIEIKNGWRLGHDIRSLYSTNDEIDTVIADCLQILSLNEMRYLMTTYLKNVIEMRKCSSEHDKEMMKLDAEVSSHKFLIWRLYMMINENKRSYESQWLTLHNEFEQKLQLVGKTATDESNDSAMVSIAGIQGRKLLSIIERNDAPESSQSDIREIRSGPNIVSIAPNIPEKSLKTLQRTRGTSSGTKVTKSKKKLIIQT